MMRHHYKLISFMIFKLLAKFSWRGLRMHILTLVYYIPFAQSYMCKEKKYRFGERNRIDHN